MREIAEILPDADAHGTAIERVAQGGRDAVRPADPRRFGPVKVAEAGKKPGVGSVIAIEICLQVVPPGAVIVDDALDVHLVQQRQEFWDVGDGP